MSREFQKLVYDSSISIVMSREIVYQYSRKSDEGKKKFCFQILDFSLKIETTQFQIVLFSMRIIHGAQLILTTLSVK